MPNKTELERQRVLKDLICDQEPHTFRDSVIAPLCQRDLIRVTETHPGGTAKRIELTESGTVVARRLLKKKS